MQDPHSRHPPVHQILERIGFCKLFGKAWRSFIPIAVLLSLPATRFELLAPGAVPGLRGLLIETGMIATTIGAIAYAVGQQVRGQPATIVGPIVFTLKRLPTLLCVSWIATLAALLGSCLTIPGLIISTGCSVAIPVLILEETGVEQTLRRSWGLTAGYRFPIFGVWCAIFATNASILVPIQRAVADTPTAFFAIETARRSAVIALYGVVATVAYVRLRIAKDDFEAPGLSSRSMPTAESPDLW